MFVQSKKVHNLNFRIQVFTIPLIQKHLILQKTLEVNGKQINMPNQLFINGEFVEAQAGKTFETINPNDESVSIFFTILLRSPLY